MAGSSILLRPRFALALACLCLIPSISQAQTPIPALPADQITWDMSGETVASASLLEYRLYLDGGATGTTLSVTCAQNAALVTCEVSPTCQDGRRVDPTH